MANFSTIMTAEEMEERFEQKEDPFDLVIEKWERLEKFLDSAFTLDDFSTFLAGCQVSIPFCRMYASRGRCDLCPVTELCQGLEDEEETMWSGLYRLIQAYGWAGDMLPPDQLKDYIRTFIESIRELRGERKPSSPRIPHTDAQ